MNRARRLDPGGFSFLEIVVVLAIVAALLAAVYPNLSRQRLEARISTDAKSLEAILFKARGLALSFREPTRMVADCARKRFNRCEVIIQKPVLDKLTVINWLNYKGQGASLNPRNTIVKADPKANHDGSESFPDVYWVIFMPDGGVRSDPKPFAVLVRDENSPKAKAAVRRVSVSAETGRIYSRREF